MEEEEEEVEEMEEGEKGEDEEKDDGEEDGASPLFLPPVWEVAVAQSPLACDMLDGPEFSDPRLPTAASPLPILNSMMLSWKAMEAASGSHLSLTSNGATES